MFFNDAIFDRNVFFFFSFIVAYNNFIHVFNKNIFSSQKILFKVFY